MNSRNINSMNSRTIKAENSMNSRNINEIYMYLNLEKSKM